MFKINNVTVAEPAYGGIAIGTEQIWSQNTGRSAGAGTMIGDIVSRKKVIEVKWGNLTFSEAQLIDDTITAAGAFFPITFYQYNTTTPVTKTVYASPYSMRLISLAPKYQKYGELTIKFVEK